MKRLKTAYCIDNRVSKAVLKKITGSVIENGDIF